MTNRKFSLVSILGQKALFSCNRLRANEIPDNLYKYDLRHGDDWGEPCTIEKGVACNFFGTILFHKEIDFNNKSYINIEEEEFGFLETHLTTDEYMKIHGKA